MTNLSKYGQNALDKTYPDSEESVFGHMCLELGMSPEDALQNIRPWVRDLDRTAATSKNVAFVTAFIGAGTGLVTAATLGIGVTAILPIAAAVYNLFIGQQSAREQNIRNSEYLLLKSCPELLKLMWALSKRGMPKEVLVDCYDELLGSFTVQYQHRASLSLSEELDHDIVRSFEQIVKQKCDTEQLAKSIIADTQDFKFDTLYQSTEPTAPRVEAPQQIGSNTRLNAVETQAQSSPQWDEDEELAVASDRYEWMNDLLSYPSVLVWGAPGAGKSTFAEWLMHERVKAGHKLEILDPHREYGQWEGLDVYGDGMNYAAIDDRLKAFADLVESRYLGRSKKADFNPRPLTVLAEEFTQWSKKCDHAPAFFEMSVSDIRKINCHVVYVSHNRTLSALGGAKGLATTRDSALLELELLAKVDEATGRAVPAFKGMLKYPGRAPIEVAIPAMKSQRVSVKVAQSFSDDEPMVSTETDDVDPAIELIQDEPDTDKQEALMISYQWAKNRLNDGKEVTRDAFLERARKERKSAYLRDNRDLIWDELTGLIN